MASALGYNRCYPWFLSFGNQSFRNQRSAMASQEPAEGSGHDAEEINPYQAPAVEIGPSISSSPRVQALRRRSGNELIYTALLCSAFGFIVPAGFVLDFLSMFFLLRVLIARHKPSPACIVLAVLVGLWNLFRILLLLLMIVVIVQQRLL